jgi:hypothetical protein
MNAAWAALLPWDVTVLPRWGFRPENGNSLSAFCAAHLCSGHGLAGRWSQHGSLPDAALLPVRERVSGHEPPRNLAASGRTSATRRRVRVVSRCGNVGGFHTPRAGFVSAGEAADAELVGASQQVGESA